jgi:hypothetical protein
MLDDLVPSITERRLRSGVATDHVDAFTDWLLSRGHSRRMIFHILCPLARWTDWPRTECASGLSIQEELERCGVYVKTTPRKLYQRTPSRECIRATSKIICFLRKQKILADPSTVENRPPW